MKRSRFVIFGYLVSFVLISTIVLFQNCSGGGFIASTFSSNDGGSAKNNIRQEFSSLSDSGKKDFLLRHSCYCIDCEESQAQQYSNSGCHFLRWGVFPWVAQDELSATKTDAQNIKVIDDIFAHVNRLANAFGATSRLDRIVEFGIPEYMNNNFDKVEVSAAQRITLNDLAAQFPEFAEKIVSGKPFIPAYIGNPRFRGVTPRLDWKVGWMWHLYMGVRAIDAGATSLYISQVNLRTLTPEPFNELISALKSYANTKYQKNLIIGVESVDHLAPGSLTGNADYVKHIPDIDIAEKNTINGRVSYFAKDQSGKSFECLHPELLENPSTQESTDGQRTGTICALASADDHLRVEQPGATGRENFLGKGINKHRLPVMLELDGCQVCSYLDIRKKWGWSNVVYYVDHNDINTTTTCNPRIRNALASNTMFYLSQPAQYRRDFLVYMSRLALILSKEKGGVPVYWPHPVKVDQNHYWQISDGSSGLSQRGVSESKLVRFCPESVSGAGQIHDPTIDGLFYKADRCGDFSTIKSILEKTDTDVDWLYLEFVKEQYRTLLERTEQEISNDQSGTYYWAEQLTTGSLSKQDLVSKFKQSDEYFIKIEMYRGILKRSFDNGKYSYWMSQLQLHGREWVRAEFIKILATSTTEPPVVRTENEQYVISLYRELLERTAEESSNDLSGIRYWSQQLDSGISKSTVESAFKASDEYFIKNAYHRLLKRKFDPPGFNYWMAQLNAGKISRAGIETAFVQACNTHISECK